MKLFGHELFNFKKEATESFYDFAQHGIISNRNTVLYDENLVAFETQGNAKPEKPKKEKKVILITPKGLFHTKALNDNNFSIKTDPEYIKKHIEDIDNKLSLYPTLKKVKRTRANEFIPDPIHMGGGVYYGQQELKSIKERLLNRSRLNEFKEILNKYPHTTNLLIDNVIQEHKHLRFHRSEEFLPDFPKEAVNAMKEYEKMCIELSNKKPVFYVVAQADDFEKKNKRRDPILLAQSPFGFFWQILGAWDDEMQYLAEL